MFRHSYNRAVIRLRIDTLTPLLIRAGDPGLDPGQADLTPVRTHHARFGSTVYIPGSSLKGVVRSAAEARVRSAGSGEYTHPDGSPRLSACDPLGAPCSKPLQGKEDLPGSKVHQRTCSACRLFGSMALKGRAAFRDLFPWPHGDGGGAARPETFDRANRTEARHNVSIHRLSGAVANGPFDVEVVPAGASFWGDVALENYQVWQLGLLDAGLDELNTGFAQLGSSKSRGLGVVSVAVEGILHEQRAAGPRHPAGVGAFATAEERRDYGLFPDLAPLPDCPSQPRGLVRRYRVEGGEGVALWLEAGRAALEALT